MIVISNVNYADDQICAPENKEIKDIHTQEHEAKFQLKIACMGSINTVINNGVAWPRTYGAGVTIETGESLPSDSLIDRFTY